MHKRYTWAVAALLTAALAVRGEPQVWKSVDGRSVTGEFVRMLGSSAVTIKTSDGSITLQLARLTEESQALARSLASGAQPAAATSATAAVTTAGNGAASANGNGLSAVGGARSTGVPTEAEIAKFQTTARVAEKGETYNFHSSFGVATLNESDKRKYAKTGKVPFRITMELLLSKTVDGKVVSKRLDGRGNIFLLDEAGMVIDRTREALGKLCPS